MEPLEDDFANGCLLVEDRHDDHEFESHGRRAVGRFFGRAVTLQRLALTGQRASSCFPEQGKSCLMMRD
jgi:hypothetical protein